MELMQEQKENKKLTLSELHREAYKDRPTRWGHTGADYFDGEWYDDDADCFCD